MKRIDLELEHQYKGKFVGRHRFRPGKRTWVMGRSRSADVRLLGEDVGDVHAYVEFQGDTWTISDAGSQSGTWLDKNPVVFESIREPATFVVGGHTLKFTPHLIENTLFDGEAEEHSTSTGTKTYHQIIVMKDDRLLDTHLLPAVQVFSFEHEGKVDKLAAPKDDKVHESKLGRYRVLQRLVKTDVLQSHSGGWRGLLTDSDMRAPIITGTLLVLLLVGLAITIPRRPNDSLNEIKPDDKYTRMVFDAKMMKKARAQAKAMRQAMLSRTPVHNAPVVAPVHVRNSGPVTKVVKNLKLGALNALLGKIAKRANHNGPMVLGFGKIADSRDTGPATAIAAVGSLQGIHTKVGKGGSTYKIGDVGTAGYGGGRSVAGFGGLAAGGAGTGTVGILDEETEIEGGLDKDVIARVIEQKLGEIRYCYERQLSANPNIYGKVQVKFTIDAAGSVIDQRIGLTTLNSAMVEGCILRRLASWRFPKPKGGTRVFVTYPFMFKAIN